MNLEEMKKAHEHIWLEVIKRGITSARSKEALSKELGYNFYLGCGPCQYVLEHYYNNQIPCDINYDKFCDKCPMNWSDCRCLDSEYSKWTSFPTKENALKVLLVPIREGYLKCADQWSKPKTYKHGDTFTIEYINNKTAIVMLVTIDKTANFVIIKGFLDVGTIWCGEWVSVKDVYKITEEEFEVIKEGAEKTTPCKIQIQEIDTNSERKEMK